MTPEQETKYSGGAGSSGTPASSSGSGIAEGESVGTREENQAAGIADTATEAMSQLGNMAEDAGRQAKSVASSLAAEAGAQARRVANGQVNVGADVLAEVAESFRAAADSLDQNVPQLAQLARGAADRVDGISEQIRDHSAAELFQTASHFAARRPALLFGAAAAVGYLVFRVLSVAPTQYDNDEDDYEFDQED